MSRVLVELLGLAPTAVHTTELDLPRVELRFEITDPRTHDPRPLPPGPMVMLVDGESKVVGRGGIKKEGRAHLLGSDASTDVGLEIDFSDREWLDLEAWAYVARKDVSANDLRPLLRLPRRWKSREQDSLSDDRSGSVVGGVVPALEDGKLGTDGEPWVLRIDHAWPRFLLELRYTNTVAATESPLPPGPLLEAAYEAGAPKARLAGACSVLDSNGLVALWVFDAPANLGDLRLLLRSADGSHIEMDASGPGVIVTMSATKHRALLPKARSRLHPLPKVLRLHEQPAEQGTHRGQLAALLFAVSRAPSRVRVPIDVLIEMRLVLHNAVSGSPMPIPPGVEVLLTDARDQPLISARSSDDGRVTLFAPPGSRDVGIEVDFAAEPYLDLEGSAFVTAEEAEPNVKRRLVRMPDRWRSVDQSSLSDDRGGTVDAGRLPALEVGKLGTPEVPWEIDIGHAWQRTELVFQYYDVTARAVRPVVFGPLVEAFDDARLRDRDLVAASTVLDTDGRVHLMFFREVAPSDLRIRFRTEGESVVKTTETDPALRVQRLAESALRMLPVAERQCHYPLPQLWLSRGQACRTISGTSAPASWFEDAIPSAVRVGVTPSRLYFDLDDFLLVNASGVPLKFARELDLTIFHHDMSIRAPRSEPPAPARGYTVAHEPYFSDVRASSNHFTGNAAFYTVGSGPEKTARVVRRGTTFYDIAGRRTFRGRVVGVRAAVAHDHPRERVFLKHAPGTAPNLANCDLHYFEDVASDPAAPTRSVSVLMVFFSVRIRRLVEERYEAEMHDALMRAAERWDGAALADVLAGATPTFPDVRLRTDDGLHDVKFVFHFPAFTDRNGHAVIWIRDNPPRTFSLSTLGVIVTDKQDAVAGTGSTGVEHAHSYPSETIAHELGHSIGLGDEYFERLHRAYVFPSVRQYPWDFLHFSFDDNSLMHGMHEPRLRHYWVLSRWLERAPDVNRVRLGEYSIVCDTAAVALPRAGRRHAFRLPSAHPWPYDPVKEQMLFRPGGDGRGHLRLYLLGDDYDIHKLPRTGVLQGIDAVLYWDFSVYLRRRLNAQGNKMSTSKLAYAERVYLDMGRAIGAVRIPTAASVDRCVVLELDPGRGASPLARNHVKKVLVYVLPRFTFSNPAAADFRLHVRARAVAPGANVTDLHNSSFHGRKILVHEDVPGQALLRYMMGLGASAARPGARIKISATPLAPGPGFAIGSTSMPSRVLHVVSARRTSGSNDFDGRGTPAEVAADLAAAINDPHNRFASYVEAAAMGNEVALKAEPAGDDVALSSAPAGTSVQPEWAEKIQPEELAFVGEWLGEQMGATYRVKAYD